MTDGIGLENQSENATQATQETQPVQAGQADQPGQNWYDGLGDEDAAYIKARGWQGKEDLLKSYRNLEKLQGGHKKIVNIPGEDATPEELAEFYNKLGRPENADRYSIKLEENAPDGINEELVGWYKNTAHELGLTDHQASKLFEAWNQQVAGLNQETQNELQNRQIEEEKALRKEWGNEFDSLVQAGRNSVKALGLNQEHLEALVGEAGGVAVANLMAKLGRAMGDQKFIDNARSGKFEDETTLAGATQKLADLKADPKFIEDYRNGVPYARQKFQQLFDTIGREKSRNGR